jgi:hypothetical protein
LCGFSWVVQSVGPPSSKLVVNQHFTTLTVTLIAYSQFYPPNPRNCG